MAVSSRRDGLATIDTKKPLEMERSTSRSEEALKFLFGTVMFVVPIVGAVLFVRDVVPTQTLLRWVLPEAWIPAGSWGSLALLVALLAMIVLTFAAIFVASRRLLISRRENVSNGSKPPSSNFSR